MRAEGDLQVSYGDGRPHRAGPGAVIAGPRGIIWELPKAGTGAVRWEQVSDWVAIELEEPRRLRAARRRVQLKIATETDDVILLLTEPGQARVVTRRAQEALPPGTVNLSVSG